MVYLIIYIFQFILFIAAPCLVILLIFKIIKNSRIRLEVKKIIVLCILIFPIAFGFILLKRYFATCKSIESIANHQSVPRQEILGVEYNVEFKERYFDIQFKAIERKTGKFCVEKIRESKYFNQCGKKREWSNHQQAKVKLLIETEKSFFGLGWILSYKIVDIASNNIITEAKEALLGRGMFGKYIGLLNMRLNNEYLACGYVYKNPYLWRKPINANAYIEQDSKLISIAIGAPTTHPD